MYGASYCPTSLFLSLFVLRMLSAPFAILFDFNLALHKLLVLARPIVNAIACLARQFYQLILRHMWQALYSHPLSWSTNRRFDSRAQIRHFV